MENEIRLISLGPRNVNLATKLFIDYRSIDIFLKIQQELCNSVLPSVKHCKVPHMSISYGKISGVDRDTCDLLLPLNLEEVTEDINHPKLNDSPGVDGLSSEFYPTQGLITVHCSQSTKRMFFSSTIGTPICLLNKDDKILVLAFGKHLKDVLDTIRDESQSG